MENEDDLTNGRINYIPGDLTANYLLANGTTINSISGTTINSIKETNFDGYPYNRVIAIPERFKDVVLKMCPEIKDIVSVGYRDDKMYNPMNFEPEYKYLVGVNLYFDETNGMKKSKKEYGDEFNDYFRMVFNGMGFVTFHVRSFIFPPEKTNEDKFFEVFGVTEK